MNVLEFARCVSHLFFEMALVMIHGTAVAGEHPRHGRCCRGQISAIIIRPGEDNRWSLQTTVEIKERDVNSITVMRPEDVRVLKKGEEK